MKKIIFLLTFLMWSQSALAFKDKQVSVGLGMFSYNMMKTADKPDASKGFMGPIYFPIEFRGYLEVVSDYYFTPRILYSLLPRTTEDKAADTNITYISLPVNGKFAGEWDWQFGFGILKYDIKGKGGTVVLNNGTGTATFARPSGSASSKIITTELGLGYSFESFRIGTELILSGMTSDRKFYSAFVYASYLFQGGN